MTPVATRERELELVRTHGIVAGMDEVGRGALAGPVAVGVCIVSGDEGDPPQGLTDSKALTVKKREALYPLVEQWGMDCTVGYSSAEEIDRWGITAALRLAGMRALGSVIERGIRPGVVLLDGTYDWLTPPDDLFAAFDGPEAPQIPALEVVTQVKADASCSVVAAASVRAKVERDAFMASLNDPGYGWASNKGYSSPAHIDALHRLGSSRWHRRSWRLP